MVNSGWLGLRSPKGEGGSIERWAHASSAKRLACVCFALFTIHYSLFTPIAATAAISLGWAEGWTNASVEGWTTDGGDFAALTHSATGGNPDGYLRGKFSATGGPPPIESDVFKATTAASGAAFTGDYIAADVQFVLFDFLAEDYLPSWIELQFYAGAHGGTGGGDHLWYYSLDDPAGVGTWESYQADFSFSSGWTRGDFGETEAEFLADLEHVEWIGVYVERSGDSAEQFYGIDNFMLAVPEPETWAMLMAVAFALGLYCRLNGVRVPASVRFWRA